MKSRTFLWCGTEMGKKSLVSWKDVCKTKKKGGLDLFKFDHMNKPMLIKNIWNLLVKNKSIWVDWISVSKPRGFSFWEVTKKTNDSFCLKSLFNLRKVLRSCYFTCQERTTTSTYGMIKF